MRRRVSPSSTIVLAAALAACATDEAPTPITTPEPSAVESATVPSADATPLLEVPVPGRPYDGEAILAAMRDSRRPGGVPDELETADIAQAVAAEVYTLTGEPWAAIAVGGSCGAEACDLEVAGAPAGGAGEDLYLFRVVRSTGSVELLQSVLLGIGPETVEELDRIARERWTGDLDAFGLSAARWQRPPDEARFAMAYRSGGEEGSPGVNLVVDVEAGTVSEAPTSAITRSRG